MRLRFWSTLHTRNRASRKKTVKIVVEGELDNTVKKKILCAITLESKSGSCSGALIDLRQSILDLSEPIEGFVKLTMRMSALGMKSDTKLFARL